MSICLASQANIFGSPRALPAGAATSRLDRELASLAGLGAAIRDEIARSLAPMKAELEMARKLVSMLEVRMRDLEARPAATAVAVSDPALPHHATGRAVETPPELTPERAETLVANRPNVEEEIASGVPNQPESAAAREAQGGPGAATGTASPGTRQTTPYRCRQRPGRRRSSRCRPKPRHAGGSRARSPTRRARQLRRLPL